MTEDAWTAARASAHPGEGRVELRAGPRFRAEVPEPRAGLRSGHIPGSRNVPFTTLLNADGTLKNEKKFADVKEPDAWTVRFTKEDHEELDNALAVARGRSENLLEIGREAFPLYQEIIERDEINCMRCAD